jgi:membrane protein implicated in regulation of membrane protease activity
MEASSGSIRFSIPLQFEALLPSSPARAVLVALAMFLVDVRTPNGLLDGFPYVVAILMCWSIPSPRAALLMAFGLMPALLFGYLLSPMGAPTWIAVTNRLVAAATLWLVALFVHRAARSRLSDSDVLSQREEQLQREVSIASSDRKGVSQWLRDDVDLELQAMEWRLNRLQRCADSGDVRTESLMMRRAIGRARQAILAEAARLSQPSPVRWERSALLGGRAAEREPRQVGTHFRIDLEGPRCRGHARERLTDR